MTSIRDTAIHLEMTGPSDGYIAIGFSDDQMMVTLTALNLPSSSLVLLMVKHVWHDNAH
jgi:hypothetical protein